MQAEVPIYIRKVKNGYMVTTRDEDDCINLNDLWVFPDIEKLKLFVDCHFEKHVKGDPVE